ncbi:hypothetical protein R1sor_023178 [Riccia sorocarpa]|uniref:Uncharacterized protein n=1 Tax=Riccia sorocarpa TaxID=122646 RepID=A0ABD3GLY4_9MARC
MLETMEKRQENCEEGNTGSSIQGPTVSVNGEMERRRDFINPVRKARRYQLEVLTKALEENTIFVLETGGGKTLIAVLLINALTPRIRKPNSRIAVFLAPNRALVDQQAKEIERHTDLHVGRFSGSTTGDNWDFVWWREQILKYEVIVMTPQILVNNMHHCFFTMEMIELLIFDECHHAQKNHPYANIMRDFYHGRVTHRPKIFGMTASPIISKVHGAEVQQIDDSLIKLESMLDAKMYTLRDRTELESLLPNPLEQIRMYEPSYKSESILKLGGLLESLGSKFLVSIEGVFNLNGEIAYKKQRDEVAAAHRNLIYCLYELGAWCTKKAAELLIDKEDQCLEDATGDAKQLFLREALSALQANTAEDFGYIQNMLSAVLEKSSLTHVEVCFVLDAAKGNDDGLSSGSALLSTRWMSSKLLCLIEILLDFRENFQRCIIFVERVISTKVVANLLNSLPCMSFLRCLPLMGSQSMSEKLQQQTIEKFRTGEVNVLVATDIAEEGLDIQSCFMVIRFDAPKQNRSYIQSRGRARKQGSHYVVLVQRGNADQLNNVGRLKENEKLMWELAANRSDAPLTLTEPESFGVEVFTVESTGASVFTNNSVSLLHRYCAKLPGDQFYRPQPVFSYFQVTGGVICEVRLPLTAPVKVVTGHVCPTKKFAKEVAALECCKRLHEAGALTDYLLPAEPEQSSLDASSDPTKTTDFSMELHPTLIPKALGGNWAAASSEVPLRAYSFHITAEPRDREYAHYALFLEEVLADCVTSLATELYLKKGRLAKVQLVPSGHVIFSGNQLKDAQLFQERILSIMLDDKKMQKMPKKLSSPTQAYWDPRRLYLMLPVVPDTSSSLKVDWASIHDVLSEIPSNVPASFPVNGVEKHLEVKPEGWDYRAPPRSCGVFQTADGPAPVEKVVNSLVETEYNGRLYCVVDVLWDMNGSSPFDGNFATYTDFFKKRYGLDLEYRKQPLLWAKPLKGVHNLIVKRPDNEPGPSEETLVELPPEVCKLEETLVELPPEVCKMRVLGFTTESANTLSLLPSVMHRLEYLLIAVELQKVLLDAFTEASKVSLMRVFQALTTAACNESLDLERLEHIGDSFLKFAVSKRLFLVHVQEQEGQLTKMRSEMISNAFLHRLGVAKEIPLYIHDENSQPREWAMPGRPFRFPCDLSSSAAIHAFSDVTDMSKVNQIKCSEGHRWLQRKTVADVVEALIGAHLVEGGPDAALAFMRWMGVEVEFDPELIARASTRGAGDTPPSQCNNLSKLEGILGYTFTNKYLLFEALTHASYPSPSGTSYERLEFLGDAVLDFLITRHIYECFPDLPPGHLSDLRTATNNNEAYARVAVRNNFQSYVLHDSPFLEERLRKFVSLMDAISQGREPFYGWDWKQFPEAHVEYVNFRFVRYMYRNMVLGDLVESLAAAVFVDTGFDLESVWQVFEPILQPIVTPDTLRLHPVRELEELCSKLKLEREFHYTRKGKLKVVTINVTCTARNVRIVETEALGDQKKRAKRLAAYRALEELKKQGFEHSYRTLTRALVSQGRLSENKSGLDSDDLLALNKTNSGVSEDVSVRPSRCDDQSPSETSLLSQATLEQFLQAAERDKKVLQVLGEEFRSKLRVEQDPGRLDPICSSTGTRNVDAVDSFNPGGKLGSESGNVHSDALTIPSGRDDRNAGLAIAEDLSNDLIKENQFSETAERDKQVLQDLVEKFRSKLTVQEDAGKLDTICSLTEVGNMDCTLDAVDSFNPWEKLDRAVNVGPLTPSASLSGADQVGPELGGLTERDMEVETSTTSRDIGTQTEDIAMGKGSAEFCFGEGYIFQEGTQKKDTTSMSEILAMLSTGDFPRGYKDSCTEDTPVGYGHGVGELLTAQPLEELELPFVNNTKPGSCIPAVGRGCMTGDLFSDSSTHHPLSAVPRGPVLPGWLPKARTYDVTVGRAREELYIICAKNHWAAPVFAPKETSGPPHDRRFTYMVSVTISTGSLEFDIECEGEPMTNTKRAMDSAAERAIAWIRQEVL